VLARSCPVPLMIASSMRHMRRPPASASLGMTEVAWPRCSPGRCLSEGTLHPTDLGGTCLVLARVILAETARRREDTMLGHTPRASADLSKHRKIEVCILGLHPKVPGRSGRDRRRRRAWTGSVWAPTRSPRGRRQTRRSAVEVGKISQTHSSSKAGTGSEAAGDSIARGQHRVDTDKVPP